MILCYAAIIHLNARLIRRLHVWNYYALGNDRATHVSKQKVTITGPLKKMEIGEEPNERVLKHEKQ